MNGQLPTEPAAGPSGPAEPQGLRQLDAVLSSQKLGLFDPDEVQKVDGNNYQLFPVTISGVTYYPAAVKLGTYQENHLLPSPTPEIIDKLQDSIRGITMEGGHFDLDSIARNDPNHQSVGFPAVKNSERQAGAATEAWAVSTVTSLLKDNRVEPGMTPGFRPRSNEGLNKLRLPHNLSPIQEYLKLVQPIWRAVGELEDVLPATCRYRCMERIAYNQCTMPGYAGIIFNNTHLIRAANGSVTEVEDQLNIQVSKVIEFIHAKDKPKVKGLNFVFDSSFTQQLGRAKYRAPVMPRAPNYALSSEKMDTTPKKQACHRRNRLEFEGSCSMGLLCEECNICPITTLPANLAQGYPLSYIDPVMGNIDVLWRKGSESHSYDGLVTIFFSKDPIRWKVDEYGQVLDPPIGFNVGGANMEDVEFHANQLDLNMEATHYPHKVMHLGWQFLDNTNPLQMSVSLGASISIFERSMAAIQKTTAPVLDYSHPYAFPALVNQHANMSNAFMSKYYSSIMSDLAIPITNRPFGTKDLAHLISTIPPRNPDLPRPITKKGKSKALKSIVGPRMASPPQQIQPRGLPQVPQNSHQLPGSQPGDPFNSSEDSDLEFTEPATMSPPPPVTRRGRRPSGGNHNRRLPNNVAGVQSNTKGGRGDPPTHTTVTLNRMEFATNPSAPLAKVIPTLNPKPITPIKAKSKPRKRSRHSTEVTVKCKGEWKTLKTSTLRRYNLDLKDMVAQSRFTPEQVRYPHPVEFRLQKNFYPVRQASDGKECFDFSKEAILRPADYYQNLENFKKLCAQDNVRYSPRRAPKPKKPKKSKKRQN